MKKLFVPLAILALLGFPIAVLGFRLDLFGFGTSFKIMEWTVYLAVAVFFLGMVLTFVKRRSNPDLSKAARTASYIAMIPIIGLGFQMFNAKSVPSIHNISTDVANPPEFFEIANIRSDEHNPLEYDAQKIADAQQAAYPEVKTLTTDLALSEAHARALEVAKSLGWEIVNEDISKGVIEATETTLIWGFKDDIVVRITDLGNERAVDLRSVSRIGRSDLGANAARIKSFLDKFDS